MTHIRARYTKHVKYHSMPMIKCDACDFSSAYKVCFFIILLGFREMSDYKSQIFQGFEEKLAITLRLYLYKLYVCLF